MEPIHNGILSLQRSKYASDVGESNRCRPFEYMWRLIPENKALVLVPLQSIFLGSMCYGSNSRRAQAGLHCISVDKLSRLVADVSLPQTQTAEPGWHHIVINAYKGREERGILENSFCPPEFWETDTQMHQSFLSQHKHLKQNYVTNSPSYKS